MTYTKQDTVIKSTTTAVLSLSHTNNHLPPELLSKIFSYLPSIAEGTLPFCHVLPVCKAWYEALIHTPRLWTTIVVHKALFERYLSDAPSLEAFFKACFIRSAPCSFELYLESYELSPVSSPDQKSYGGLLRRIFTFAAKDHMDRLRYFVWTSSEGAFAQGTELAKAFPSHLPMLEHLSIIEDDSSRIGTDHTNLPPFPHSPKLRSLYWLNNLHSPYVPWLRDADVARIEEFALTNSLEWVDFDVAFIGRFSGLRILALEDDHAEHTGTSWYTYGDRPIAQLPLLETLVLSGEVPNFILDGLVVPVLMTLKIQVTRTHTTSLSTIPPAILKVVKNMHVVVKPGSGASVHGALRNEWRVQHLKRIIGLSPFLQQVYISSGLLEGLMEIEDLENSREWTKLVGI